MATNGSTGIDTVEVAPGRSGVAYVLPALYGENIYIPCSKSATRLLVTGKETDNAFAVVGSGGTTGDPIGFHFHREAHDVFLCLKGAVKIWANDQCRVLTPGDLASVPPLAVHQYQIVGDYTEFVGLVVPGGWEEFFRFIGEPYDGPLFPETDDRNIFEVLIPKLKQAAEKFDMIPQPHYKGATEAQPWRSDADNVLPGKPEPYFLKGNSGPKYLVGGIICRPMVSMAESNNRFSICSIEGSSAHENVLFSAQSDLTFDDAHLAFHVSDGYVDFTVNGASSRLSQGETLYVPQGSKFNFGFASRFSKAYVFANGGGLQDLLCKVGEPYKFSLPPKKETSFDASRLSQ